MKNQIITLHSFSQFFFILSLILFSISPQVFASPSANNMQDLINQLNQISQQNTNSQTKNKNMNNVMQKFSKQLENMTKSINPNNPIESINKINNITQKLAVEKPCSWFRSMPKSSTLTHCFPISVNVSYDIYEKNIGNLDRPEEADEIKWALDNRLLGELIVWTKPNCNKISKKCIDYFSLNAPGANMAGAKNTQVILHNGYAKYLIGDGRGNTRMTSSDTGNFYTYKNRAEGDMGSISFNDIYPSNTKSSGAISIPDFGWIDIHNEKHEPSTGGRLLLDALDIPDKNNISRYALDFLPNFKDIMKLFKTQSYKYQFPVNIKVKDYIARGNIKYTISLKIPGKLKVTPSSDFVATRSSPKKRYKPRNKRFTLTNTGKSKLTYKISENANWLTIKSKKRGSIKPHQKVNVKIALTNEADKLKRGKYKTLIYFKDLTNGAKISKKARLKNREKWRFTIFQKDELFFGDQYIYGGVAAKLRTDIDIVIEDGKYKKGVATAHFLSVKSISFPLGVFNCIVNQKYGTWIKNKSFSISGRVMGNSVKLNISPENAYVVNYNCITDKDKYRDYIYQKHEKNRKGNKIRYIKSNGKWGVKYLSDKQIQDGIKLIKENASMDADRVVNIKKQRFLHVLYPEISKRTKIIPLKNFSKDYGNLKNINFLRIRMQQIE